MTSTLTNQKPRNTWLVRLMLHSHGCQPWRDLDAYRPHSFIHLDVLRISGRFGMSDGKIKDRQQSIWPVLLWSQYTDCPYIPSALLYTSCIPHKSWVSGVFNDIKYIKIHGFMSILSNNEFENLILFLIFLNKDNSVNIP